jgi:hypothetical protein
MESKKKAVVVDGRTVDIADDYAIDYWTRELNTTKPKLLAAVAEVGEQFAEVKRYLRK